MTLKDYLAQPGRTASQLAEKCGVSVSTVTRSAKGDMWPSRSLMALFLEHTGGAVTPNDFLSQERAA